MNKILISINPAHVDNILLGIKKYEYRTKIAKKDINRIIVYSTYPTKKVVAEVEIIEILSGTPEELWRKTSTSGCITREFFDKYFYNREIAYAYKLGAVKRFEEPKELIEYGVTYAPQSFIYI